MSDEAKLPCSLGLLGLGGPALLNAESEEGPSRSPVTGVPVAYMRPCTLSERGARGGGGTFGSAEHTWLQPCGLHRGSLASEVPTEQQGHG